ncbi:Na/Pi cotransporter family protein [archaeon]|nr:Na/Pi cotransporter family protein [archaeon]
MNLEILFGVLPALILFLYGIEHFSDEIKNLAGDKFRELIGKLTKNPVRGVFLGAFVTSIIQSSTATTVITVSLVNSGIISFTNSLGIIFGSNIGTTITAQLIALKLTSFAPVFIVIGFLITFFSKKHKIIGKPFFYFGLVFYALALVSAAVEPIKSDPAMIELFSNLSNIPLAVIVGFVFTSVVQSSSVTTGLIIVLTQNGLIDLRAGIPLLLGANIGTSTTAVLASLGLNLYARRAGIANLMFNIVGSLLLIPFIDIFIYFIKNLGGTPASQMANAHMIFNIITAIIFLFLIKQFTKLINKMVPGEEDEILFETKYLTENLPENNAEALKLIKAELKYSIDITILLYKQTVNMFKRPKKAGFAKLEKLESLNDYLDEKIEKAILTVSHRKLSKNEAKKTVILVQISNAIEQLGDLGEDLGKISFEMFESGKDMSYESIEAVDTINKKFKATLLILKENLPYVAKKMHNKIKGSEEEILNLINKKYEEHIERLQEENDYKGGTFVESISIIESSVSKMREIRKLCEKFTKLKT